VSLLAHHNAELRGLVTDINLWQGIDGWEVARAAREAIRGLPVIYISASQRAGLDFPRRASERYDWQAFCHSTGCSCDIFTHHLIGHTKLIAIMPSASNANLHRIRPANLQVSFYVS
jgi:CheY-like chemotaxis protein